MGIKFSAGGEEEEGWGGDMAGVGLLFRCYTRTVAADVASINKKKEHTPPPEKKQKVLEGGRLRGGRGGGQMEERARVMGVVIRSDPPDRI